MAGLYIRDADGKFVEVPWLRGKDAPQEAVLFESQALTEAQQAQARKNIDAAKAFSAGEGLVMDGDVLAAKKDGYRLLQTLTFEEDAEAFSITQIGEVPLKLRAMLVIMDRIGDGESANGLITPTFYFTGANGNEKTFSAGYFYGIGAQGSCWYVKAEIDGDAIDADGASMDPGANAQISNGWMNSYSAKQFKWRNLPEDYFPAAAITGMMLSGTGKMITAGSRMWIYGKNAD